MSDVTVITYSPRREPGDSYQGTPSGVPNVRKKRPASAAVLSPSLPAALTPPCEGRARTFFVTSSTWGKQSLPQSDRAAVLFLRVLYDYRAQNKFRLHEFVVMPDHFQLNRLRKRLKKIARQRLKAQG